METGQVFLAALLAGMVCLSNGVVARASSGQSFTGSGAPAGMEGVPGASGQPAPRTPAASDAPDSSLCADGKRAIDQGRWADAVKIFTQVAAQHGDHADGALYWKAYAEDKLGQSKPSQSTCAALRSSFPKSRWVEDCGA